MLRCRPILLLARDMYGSGHGGQCYSPGECGVAGLAIAIKTIPGHIPKGNGRKGGDIIKLNERTSYEWDTCQP